ncbi:MAG: PQQ-dependent catabolism-associated CXXCW motif protein [Candidatus Competibacterales bacterium]
MRSILWIVLWGSLGGLGTSLAATPPQDPQLPMEALGFDGYREYGYRAPTPPSSPVAWTVDTREVRTLLETQQAVAVDVAAAVRRPAGGGLPAAWIPSAPRRDIPGSVWLPNVGYPTLSPAMDDYFRRELQRITQGRLDRGLVFYCVVDCWLSWNAVLRAASYGYTRLYWYPAGTDGWANAGLPLVDAVPVPLTSPADATTAAR